MGASAASDGEQGLTHCLLPFTQVLRENTRASYTSTTNAASSAAAFRTLQRVPVFFGAATQIRAVRREQVATCFVDNMDGLCRVSYRTTTGGVSCVPLMGPIRTNCS